jgi:hypothetical protein
MQAEEKNEDDKIITRRAGTVIVHFAECKAHPGQFEKIAVRRKILRFGAAVPSAPGVGPCMEP